MFAFTTRENRRAIHIIFGRTNQTIMQSNSAGTTNSNPLTKWSSAFTLISAFSIRCYRCNNYRLILYVMCNVYEIITHTHTNVRVTCTVVQVPGDYRLDFTIGIILFTYYRLYRKIQDLIDNNYSEKIETTTKTKR